MEPIWDYLGLWKGKQPDPFIPLIFGTELKKNSGDSWWEEVEKEIQYIKLMQLFFSSQ